MEKNLKDTHRRCVKYFKKEIVPKLKSGENVLIVAHGNSLRTLVMEIEKMSSKKIENFEMEVGEIITYTYRQIKKYLGEI